MKVCMVTGLNKLKRYINFKNAGGMGTQVPLLSQKLRERGIEVSIDDPTNCDIIHLHNPMPNFLPLIKKAKRNGVKVVIHARHLPELVKGGFMFDSIIYPLFELYSRYFYNLADAVVCATPYVKNWMEKNGVKVKLYVIPNGVDCSLFKPSTDTRNAFRHKYGLEDEFVILSVGLMIPRKGVHDFLKVAKRCSDKKFVWVGSTEKTLKSVKIEPPDNFINIPYVPFEEMPSVYNGGDVFFFPTYAESYGNVLFEAMACKKPPVIRDIPVYKEWFKDGENCIKGKTTEDFARAIEKLSTDSELRKKISNNAYSTAKLHDISNTIDALIKMYEALLSNAE